jgi:hypothetical protein
MSSFESPLDRIPSLTKLLQRADIDTDVLDEVLQFHIEDVYATLSNDFDQYEDPLSYLTVLDYLDTLARAKHYLCPSKPEQPDLPSSQRTDDEPGTTSGAKNKSKGTSKKG